MSKKQDIQQEDTPIQEEFNFTDLSIKDKPIGKSGGNSHNNVYNEVKLDALYTYCKNNAIGGKIIELPKGKFKDYYLVERQTLLYPCLPWHNQMLKRAVKDGVTNPTQVFSFPKKFKGTAEEKLVVDFSVAKYEETPVANPSTQ